MTAEEFVLIYKALQPKMGEYEKSGVSATFIKEDSNTYDVNKRLDDLYESEILTLINNYDCRNIAISTIRFLSSHKDDLNFFYFGFVDVEEDRLAIFKETGQIVVVENHLPHIMNICAKDERSFLEILIVLKGFFSNNVLIPGYYEDESNAQVTFETCVKLAGGTEYENFYEYLLL